MEAPSRPLSGNPRVAVVIITHNGERRIGSALAHASALPERPRIVVVDNGSVDGTREVVRRNFPEVQLIESPRNLGAAGRNLGAAAVDAPYIAFAEDDSWYEAGALARAADILDGHPEIALINAQVLVGPEGRPDPLHEDMVGTGVSDAPELPGHPILSFLEGACVVRRSAYLAVGGFDARLFIGGPEEHLAADLLSAGWKLRYVAEVVAHHHPEHRRPAGVVRRLGVRNTLWFAWGRRPLRPALRWTWHVVSQSPRNVDTAMGLGLALVGLPEILRHRRPLPFAVERDMSLLDEPKRRSKARRYGGRAAHTGEVAI